MCVLVNGGGINMELDSPDNSVIKSFRVSRDVKLLTMYRSQKDMISVRGLTFI